MMSKKKGFTPLETTGQSENVKRSLTGFTLIELMVVIAIIAVLAAVVTPQIFRQIEKGRAMAVVRFYNSVQKAATAYFADIGEWPPGCGWGVGANCNTISSPDGTFVTPPSPAGSNPNWDGPYLERWPSTNPWGANFCWGGSNCNGYGWNNNPNNYYCNGGLGGCPSAGERFILTLFVPRAAMEKIDLAIDGEINGLAGVVRACCPPSATWATATNINILISRDGPVS